MQAVALATREIADLLLLVSALEVEAREIGPAIELLLADHDLLLAARDLLPRRHFGVERAILVGVGDLHGVADLQRTAVGFFLIDDHLEQRCFPRAVRADDANDAAARQRERPSV